MNPENRLNYCDSHTVGSVNNYYTETRHPRTDYSVINARGEIVDGNLACVTDFSAFLVPTGILSGNKIPQTDSEAVSFNPNFGMNTVVRFVEYKDKKGDVIHTDFHKFPQIDPEISGNMLESSSHNACVIQQRLLREALFKVTTHDSGIQLVNLTDGKCFFEFVDNEIPLVSEPNPNEAHGLIPSNEWRGAENGSERYRWFLDSNGCAIFEMESGDFPYIQQHPEYAEMHKISMVRGVKFGNSLKSPQETLDQLRHMAQVGVLSKGINNLINPYIRLEL